MLVGTSSVGGNATLSLDLWRGGLRKRASNRGRRDEFFAMRRKEFLCEREGNCKVV